MSPKTRLQVLLEPEQLAVLRRIQDRTGAPVSAQVRRAVDAWIAEHGDDKKTAPRRSAKRRNA